MKADLELKDLDQFYGTENYTKIMGVNVTDGITYVMENGYSWFITDFIAVLKLGTEEIRKAEFLAIKLKLSSGSAQMQVTDGNDKVLYTQEYRFTDAKRELTLFYTNGVLMLSGEW